VNLVRRIAQRAVCTAGVLAGLMMSLAGAQARQSSGAIVLPPDADIRKVLAERVDTLAGQEDGVGIVVGVVGPQGRRVISYGHLNHGDPRPLDGETGFEIGSVTKVFTALLLAEMVRKGDVALADPVAKHLPAAKIPERNGRSITLLDLATHTSGLPFMPDASASDDSVSTKYGSAQLYQFLADYALPRDRGAEWDYSNIGYWLLAQALTSRAAMDFESLLRTRVIGPLKLTSTAMTPSPRMKVNLAVGHNAVLQPSGSFSTLPIYSAMAAAGGLVSTANDLLTFLAATMGYEPSPLAPAMATMLSTRRPMPRPGEAQALGWVVIGDGDDQLIVHDGGTLGYVSSVAWDPKQRVGVVVLSNQVAGVGDIARHLLRPDVPMERPTAMKRIEIALDATVLDTYAGGYEARDEGAFIVVREHDFLTIQPPADWGLPKLRLRPESLREFFVAELPLRVAFQTGSDGRVNGLLVHPPRGQQAILANRMDSDAARRPR
jgi:D-alanyl-D-alanine-carboxypeptidase/D-alanyl-D-alanine-endopeptidase